MEQSPLLTKSLTKLVKFIPNIHSTMSGTEDLGTSLSQIRSGNLNLSRSDSSITLDDEHCIIIRRDLEQIKADLQEIKAMLKGGSAPSYQEAVFNNVSNKSSVSSLRPFTDFLSV